MPGVGLATIGAVTAVAGTGLQLKAASEARSGQRLQRRQQELVTRRERRQSIRQAQRLRAQAVASASGTGALGSSGLAGGLSSLASQTGEGLGFSTQGSGLSRDIGAAFDRSSRLGSIGDTAVGLGGLAFRQGGGFSGLKSEIAELKGPAPTRPPGSGGGRSGLAPNMSLFPNTRPGAGAPPYYPYGMTVPR